jgi:glutathione S-transferase
MYTYTAHAPEGHLELDRYPAIRLWLAGIESIPGYVAMPRTEPRFGFPDPA